MREAISTSSITTPSILAAALFLGACGLMQSSGQLTEGEQASVAAGLNRACPGAAWCAEGSEYSFTSVACSGDRSECQVSFDVTVEGRIDHGTVDVSGHSQVLEGTDVHETFVREVGEALAGWTPAE